MVFIEVMDDGLGMSPDDLSLLRQSIEGYVEKGGLGLRNVLEGPSIAGWTLTLISKQCKDPERAIRFMSYMMSEEGQQDIYLGPEGVTWEEKDGKRQFLPEVILIKPNNICIMRIK